MLGIVVLYADTADRDHDDICIGQGFIVVAHHCGMSWQIGRRVLKIGCIRIQL